MAEQSYHKAKEINIIPESKVKYESLSEDKVYSYIKHNKYKNYIIGDSIPLNIYKDGDLNTIPTKPNELNKNKIVIIGEFLMSILSFLCLLLSSVFLLLFMIYGWLITFICFCNYDKRYHIKKKYYTKKRENPKQGKCENICYSFCFFRRTRRYFGTKRLQLLEKTNFFHKCSIFYLINNYFTSLYQLLEMIICNGLQYSELWENYADEFGEWFPTFFGLGNGEYNIGTEMSSNTNPTTGYHDGYLSNSPSYYKYLHTPLMSLFLPDRSPAHLTIRQSYFKWLYTLSLKNKNKFNSIFENQYDTLKPSDIYDDKDIINQKKLQRIINDLLFYVTIGERFNGKELDVLDLLSETTGKMAFLSGSLPKYLSFLLFGHKYSRDLMHILYTLSYAFYRNSNTMSMIESYKETSTANIDIWSTCKVFAQIFIPNSMGISTLVMDIIYYLNQNPTEYVPLYNKDPVNFINEVLRIKTPLPWMNTYRWTSPKKLNIAGIDYLFPTLTPFTISMIMANQDRNIFGQNGQDPKQFNPKLNTDNTLTFKGKYGDIISNNINKRPTRYCPAMQLVIYKIVPFLVYKFCKLQGIENKMNKMQYHQLDNRSYNKEIKYSVNIDNNIDDIDDDDDDDEKYNDLKIIDRHTKILIKLVNEAGDKFRIDPITADEIKLPIEPNQHLEKHYLPNGIGLVVNDEDNPKGLDFVAKIGRYLISSPLIKFVDLNDEWDNVEQAISFKTTVFGENIPKQNVIIDELTSNESISRLAFFGLPCHLTKKFINDIDIDIDIDINHNLAYYYKPKNAVYYNDLSDLGLFPVRDGYERYGAITYFDINFKLIAIYTCYNNKLIYSMNEDQDINNVTIWDYSKWIWKCSVGLYVTVRNHALETHMIESNSLVVSVRENLPTNHPLRIFLKPFIFRTVTININASNSLIKPNAIFHRLFAMPWESFVDFFKHCTFNYKFSYLNKNYIDKSMNNEKEYDYPIKYDIDKYWNITYKFIMQWLDIYYPSSSSSKDNNNDDIFKDIYQSKLYDGESVYKFIQNLCKLLGIKCIPINRNQFVNILTQCICNATVIHEHVGQISDYLTNPQWVGVKIRKKINDNDNDNDNYNGLTTATIQDFAQTLSLTVLTGLKQPMLLQDWSQLIIKDKHYDKVLNNYKQYKNELNDLSILIDQHNDNKSIRKYPFNNYNPKYLESSISV